MSREKEKLQYNHCSKSTIVQLRIVINPSIILITKPTFSLNHEKDGKSTEFARL